MLTLINKTKQIFKFNQCLHFIPISYNKYIYNKSHLQNQHCLQHSNYPIINCKYKTHFYQHINIKMYSYLHKTTNSIFQYNKHTGKIIFGIIVICCSYLIWYFLYYKNKKIIHEFIDFEIKRTLSKLFTNNTSIISFLSKEINSILTHPQFQEQVNLFILNNYIHNDKLRLHIQNKSKEFIIDYLQSENAVIHISNIIKFFINSEFGRNKIKELLYNYMELNGKEYLTDLLEMKIIQMINDEDFRTYVCNEINNEIQKYLKQKESIQYMIESLKKEFKV